MRIRRPRTLLSLTLVGLGLVTLPLLVGVGNAMLKLNELFDESETVVRASLESTRENELASQALSTMRRYVAQYFLVATAADPKLRTDTLGFYREHAANFASSLEALRGQEHSDTIDAQLDLLDSMLAVVNATLTSEGSTRDGIEETLAAMAASANTVKTIMRDDIDRRMVALGEATRDAQGSLAWQSAALLPGTLILVLIFALLVGRPMRQIDRAIRELGKGDFSHPIAVTGPNDIETLGRQLEWLRIRLAETTEEKNKFLRHMSHELKTPLANIREGTELLLDGAVGALDRQQQEVTGILRENSVKLQRLIENLLTFSAWQAKTASLAISEFELKPLVFSVLSQHRLVISSREIKLKLDVAPIKVRADEGKLRLVLENLLSNAIKFTPEKGTIALRAQMDGGELVIEVADSGPGIASEDTPRIFEAFYQGRRLQGGPVGGTGIGLSVVNECVQAHGGTVVLDDETCSGSPDFSPGGAHFVVRLPLRRADDRPKLVVSNG